MLREAPEAVESIYDAYNAVAIGFSFTGRLKDGFIHIATYSRHVNLGFNHGASLPDPEGVLRGTGTSVRHIRIEKGEDSKREFLGEYIRAAIEQVGGAGRGAGSGAAGEGSLITGSKLRRRGRYVPSPHGGSSKH